MLGICAPVYGFSIKERARDFDEYMPVYIWLRAYATSIGSYACTAVRGWPWFLHCGSCIIGEKCSFCRCRAAVIRIVVTMTLKWFMSASFVTRRVYVSDGLKPFANIEATVRTVLLASDPVWSANLSLRSFIAFVIVVKIRSPSLQLLITQVVLAHPGTMLTYVILGIA